MGGEDSDYHDPELTGANRNIDLVYFGDWKIQTWFDSPYPLTETRVSESEYPACVASQQQRSNLPSLFVCEKCFQYYTEFAAWAQHQPGCTCDSPPGRKVYHQHDTRIWEIDGGVNSLYCQKMSLFGKFFLGVGPTSVDVYNYLFYVLARTKDGKDNIIGFFSKEKTPRGEHNLSWLVIFPQWQRSRYGTLMIEFSYELSRRVGEVGGPRRPLTSLGLRGYLSYWVATLVRFFRQVLSILPLESPNVLVTLGNFPDPHDVQRSLWKRRVRNGDANDLHAGRRTMPAALDVLNDPKFTHGRRFATHIREDGSAETHVHVDCTLADVATATNLRPDDAAFALNELGLLSKRLKRTDGCVDREIEPGYAGDGETLEDSDQTIVVITMEMVETIARTREIKEATLDLNCIIDLPQTARL